MTQFEQLLENFNAGKKAQEQVNNLLRWYLKEIECTVVREVYGIGCTSHSVQEISDILGFEESEVMQIFKTAIAKLEACIEAGDKKLADCTGVKDNDFKNLNLNKEITIKEYIDSIESKQMQSKKINKRQGELYHIAKKNLPIIMEINPINLEEVENIPLSEIINYVSLQEYRKNYNHINRLAPTFGALLRYEGVISPTNPKLYWITILKWKHLIQDNLQEIIDNWKEFNSIVEYPRHYDTSCGVEDNLKLAYLEIADTLDERVGNKRYSIDERWSKIIRMKYRDNMSNDEIGKYFDLTHERIRQIISEISNTLENGEVFCENIKLIPDLLSHREKRILQTDQTTDSIISDSKSFFLKYNEKEEENRRDSVYRVGCNWEYIQDPREIIREFWELSEEIDGIVFIPITDRVKEQVCILRKGDKYGIYTLDHTSYFGGPGTWCSQTLIPFPYDEVKYCAFPYDYEYGLFAFRIGNKWGIIKVIDGSNEEEGIYDVELGLTKRRIIVPCKHVSFEEAEHQLRDSYDWKDLFAKEVPQKKTPAKREVKKGNGKDKIRVTFPDGIIIEESIVWKTMAETIKRLGVQRVEKLKIPGIIKRNIFLVDTHPTDDTIYKDQQKEIEPGYYLLVYNNTEHKANCLERISDELHANLKIELITYQV